LIASRRAPDPVGLPRCRVRISRARLWVIDELSAFGLGGRFVGLELLKGATLHLVDPGRLTIGISGGALEGEYVAGLEAAEFDEISVEFTQALALGIHGAIVKAVKALVVEPTAADGRAGTEGGFAPNRPGARIRSAHER
jgi:hypothetical protein